MIIIHSKKVRTYVYFDKNTRENGKSYKLSIVNRTTNDEYTFENLENISTMADYYDFRISFSEVSDGEYEYTLTYNEDNKEKIVDKGLLVVGEYEGLEQVSYDVTRKFVCYDPLEDN